MAKRSISISKGRGSIAHNNREFIAENVKKERIKDNITFKKESLESAYEYLFGDAIREYNANQKRADRRIDGVKGYMSKLENSKNGEKLFYENVVQVGNMHDCGLDSSAGDIAKEVLSSYMNDFEKRNPNLYVFNAVLHLDEQTPHLHIDYIPVAHGYKTGLQARNSLDKALGEQGIEGKSNKFENRTHNWQEREKDHIEAIMHSYGLERAEEKGIKAPKLSVAAYKTTVNEIENQIQSLPNEIEAKPIPLTKDKVAVSVADLNLLERNAKLEKTREIALQEIYSAERENLEDISRLKREQLEATQSAKGDKERYEALRIQQEELNKSYDDVVAKNRELLKIAQNQAELIKGMEKEFDNELEKQKKPLLDKIKILTDENGLLRKTIDKLQRIIENIKPHNIFKQAKHNDVFNLRDKGLLIALYEDGTQRQVGANRNGGLDDKTLEDKQAGLCKIGYWDEERSVIVPEHIFEELVESRDLRVEPSDDLERFIEHSIGHDEERMERMLERERDDFSR